MPSPRPPGFSPASRIRTSTCCIRCWRTAPCGSSANRRGALRLPSVLFAIASLWALFLVGRRIVGRNEALLACALATVSYHHIWFSGNARGYMGLLFFTCLASWLWLEALERNAWSLWIGYAVAVALGLWIHMTMLFVVGSHVLISAVVWWRSGRDPVLLRRAAAAFLLCGTLTLQVYALALPEFFRSAVSESSPHSQWTNPLWMLRESVRSLEVAFVAAPVVLCGGLLVAAGWLDILRRQARAGWAMVIPAVAGGAACWPPGTTCGRDSSFLPWDSGCSSWCTARCCCRASCSPAGRA